MTDTAPEIAERYRAMLLARSPEERLKMACSMNGTARALVRASILARDPQASPAAVRRALFLRFYGHEFAASERERIMSRLGEDVIEAPRRPRRVPVDWDGLTVALTANPAEWTCYLDARSGEVLMIPVDRLGGDDWPSEEVIETELEAEHLIPVEPLGSSVEYGWMTEFTSAVGDARLRHRLEAALEGRGAFRRFKDALLDHPAERERWFAFWDERLREAARQWIEEHNIEATTALPVSGR